MCAKKKALRGARPSLTFFLAHMATRSHASVFLFVKSCYSYSMRKFILLVLCFSLFAPALASAQSLEWLAEHPGSTTPAMLIAGSAPATQNTNDGLESRVRAYFSDIPVMAAIAECESQFRQFDIGGQPLDGGAGGMIGLYQINASVHADLAKSLGMDIDTVDGNLAYARKLYTEDGTDPWLDSFSCWHPLMQAPVAAGGKTTLTQDLVLGTISPEVKALQVLLNGHGYVLAPDGPGSPGEETTKYGALTRVAVRKFQCDKMQLCSGDEVSNVYGLVGAQTRELLLGLADDASIAPLSPTNPSVVATTDEAAQIAALQKQIEELSAQLFALKQKLGKS